MRVRHERLDDVPKVIHPGGADFVRGPLADYVELPFKRLVVRTIGAAADEYLAHDRLACPRGFSKGGIVCRDGPPAENGLAFLGNDLFHDPPGVSGPRWIRRREDKADAVLSRLGQREMLGGADLRQEVVRHLHQDAGAVAGVGLATASAPVIEIDQNGERLFDDGMRLPAPSCSRRSRRRRRHARMPDRKDPGVAAIPGFPWIGVDGRYGLPFRVSQVVSNFDWRAEFFSDG